MPDSIFQKWLTMRGYDQPVDENYVMGDLPYSPSSMAVAVTPKNVKGLYKIISELADAYRGRTPQGLPDYNSYTSALAGARAFMETRYPRFSKSADYLFSLADDLPIAWSMPPTAAASFNPSHYGRKGIATFTERVGNVPNAVKAIAHEMLHARDGAKRGINYLYEEAEKGVPYLEREVEKRAVRAGNTAQKAFYKYMDLLSKME